MAKECGGWWDWLLCLGIAVLLGAPLPTRNPEGHSPKWWKRHPEAIPSTSRYLPKRDRYFKTRHSLCLKARFYGPPLVRVSRSCLRWSAMTKATPRWLLIIAWPWGALA